jgi:hypothetical protein
MLVYAQRCRIAAVALSCATFHCLGLAVPARALTIDDFDVGAISVSRTGATVATAAQTGLDAEHVVGGSRNIRVGPFGSAVQTLTVEAALGELQFSSTSQHGYFDITYGADAAPLTIDLTAHHANGFLLNFGPGSFTSLNFIRITSATGTSASGGGALGSLKFPLSDGGMLLVVPYSTFSGAADLTSVQKISLEFVRLPPTPGVTIRNFSTVPEPRGVALTAMVAAFWRTIRGRSLARQRRRNPIAAGGARRRRRRSDG